MKSYLKITAVGAVLALLLGGCGATTATIYLLSEKPHEGAQKIGCEEYLMPVTTTVSGSEVLKASLTALLQAKPADYGADLTTASAFKDGVFEVDDVSDPEQPTNSDQIHVYLKRVVGKGLAGVCDTPRVKNQITETVRAYAVQKHAPFTIALDGTMKNWECLGDESGRCQDSAKPAVKSPGRRK